MGGRGSGYFDLVCVGGYSSVVFGIGDLILLGGFWVLVGMPCFRRLVCFGFWVLCNCRVGFRVVWCSCCLVAWRFVWMWDWMCWCRVWVVGCRTLAWFGGCGLRVSCII